MRVAAGKPRHPTTQIIRNQYESLAPSYEDCWPKFEPGRPRTSQTMAAMPLTMISKNCSALPDPSLTAAWVQWQEGDGGGLNVISGIIFRASCVDLGFHGSGVRVQHLVCEKAITVRDLGR